MPLISLVVLLFCTTFMFIVLSNSGNAWNSVKIIITYWFPLFIFLQLENDSDNRDVFFTKAMLFLFVVTLCTTYINLLENPSIARALTAGVTAEERVAELQRKNCGDIYLIQSAVMLVPFLINNIAKRIHSIISAIAIVFIFIILLQASFTIALIVFAITLVLSVIFSFKTSVSIKLVIAILIFAIIAINLGDILLFLKNSIDNEYINERVSDLIRAIEDRDVITTKDNFSGRYLLYKLSFDTFKENIFGIGPLYFVATHYGVGNHSQILDDMARYGIFAIAFYVAFFVGYYKFLKERWSKINSANVVIPFMVSMILFLFLNVGFRGNHESLVTLFIMPGLPAVLEKHIDKKQLQIK